MGFVPQQNVLFRCTCKILASKVFSVDHLAHILLLIFHSIDADHLFVSSPSNGIIKKKNMKVRLLEKTSKVKAEGLPPKSTSDLIMLYFDKFAEVEDDGVTFETDQSAIITFTNPEGT